MKASLKLKEYQTEYLKYIYGENLFISQASEIGGIIYAHLKTSDKPIKNPPEATKISLPEFGGDNFKNKFLFFTESGTKLIRRYIDKHINIAYLIFMTEHRLRIDALPITKITELFIEKYKLHSLNEHTLIERYRRIRKKVNE